MVPGHPLFGVLVGFVAGGWGWMAGQPIQPALFHFVFGGMLGMAASVAVMILHFQGNTAAQKAEAAARTIQSPQRCPRHAENAVRIAVVEHQQKAPG